MAKSVYKEFGPGVTSKVKNLAIGIDQSYSGFGITVMDVDSEAYKTVVFKGEGIGVDRLLDINQKLSEFLNTNLPDKPKTITAAMEGYAFGSQMAHMAGELGAVVKLTLRMGLQFGAFDCRYPLIVPPTMLKKYVVGKGTGVQKNQILLNVFKKWHVEFNDDNAADSYALARIAAGKANQVYEKEVIEKLHDPKFREK